MAFALEPRVSHLPIHSRAVANDSGPANDSDKENEV